MCLFLFFNVKLINCFFFRSIVKKISLIISDDNIFMCLFLPDSFKFRLKPHFDWHLAQPDSLVAEGELVIPDMDTPQTLQVAELLLTQLDEM